MAAISQRLQMLARYPYRGGATIQNYYPGPRAILMEWMRDNFGTHYARWWLPPGFNWCYVTGSSQFVVRFKREEDALMFILKIGELE